MIIDHGKNNNFKIEKKELIFWQKKYYLILSMWKLTLG
jgi:hypothetical protein